MPRSPQADWPATGCKRPAARIQMRFPKAPLPGTPVAGPPGRCSGEGSRARQRGSFGGDGGRGTGAAKSTWTNRSAETPAASHGCVSKKAPERRLRGFVFPPCPAAPHRNCPGSGASKSEACGGAGGAWNGDLGGEARIGGNRGLSPNSRRDQGGARPSAGLEGAWNGDPGRRVVICLPMVLLWIPSIAILCSQESHRLTLVYLRECSATQRTGSALRVLHSKFRQVLYPEL